MRCDSIASRRRSLATRPSFRLAPNPRPQSDEPEQCYRRHDREDGETRFVHLPLRRHAYAGYDEAHAMAKLIYVMPLSLDGYIADESESLDWSVPSDEFLAFISDLLRPIGTYLYGRKMYETMAVWETPEVLPVCRRSSSSSRESGKRPRRSSTQSRWRPFLHRGRVSIATSTRRPFAT